MKKHPLALINRFAKAFSPVQTITCGYGIYIFVIFLLLCLPFTWKFESISWIDHLFMAASAVSTTGLATVNTPDAYNFWGQLAILLGIQLGGLGYMTFGSFAILASRGRVSDSRIQIGRSVFSMPDEFEPVAFIRRVVIFSLGIELLGAVGLYFAFSRAGVESPLWPAVFHSISAFCTAGFSVFPNSLESYRADGWINLIVSVLSILGATGFIVMSDLWLSLRRRKHSLTLTSKIILIATGGGIVVGTLLLFFDATFTVLPFGERLMASFFQSMSALTTVGFNTHPIGVVSHASVMALLVLMILGASPSGTGGGLKSTTWSAGIASAWSVMHGKKEVTFLGRVVPAHRIQAAFAAFTLYLLIFAFGCFVLLLADRHTFEDVVFEVGSALGTVGLSRGITGTLTDAGKLVVIMLMFFGRVGVISLGLAVLARRGGLDTSSEEADIVI